MAQAISEERMNLGVKRLLQSPLTLDTCGAAVWDARPLLATSRSHQDLFEEYREEVDFVTAYALEWWDETILARMPLTTSKKAATAKAWSDRPAGPASFPGLVALLRDYWLACHALNEKLPEADRVPPWIFLLDWLGDGSYKQTVSVLACMPYWPIGLDQDGNWV